MSTRLPRRALPALILAVAIVLALAAVLAGGGGSHHHGRPEPPDPDLNGPQRLAAPLPASIVPDPPANAVASQSATPDGAILAFATVYAHSSLSGLAGRESTLLAYSSASYAARLRGSYAQARAQTARALPNAASMTGGVEALAMRAGTASQRSGLVSLGQSLQLPGQASQPVVIVNYNFKLQHTLEGWRVAAFDPELKE